MNTEEKIDRILALVEGMSNGGTATAKSTAGEVADDFDLDGKYGDEDIRKDPSKKYWTGDSFVGRKMSECTAEFLDAFAKYKDACAYMNEKSGDVEKAKYIGYDRKSARRARGWAKRLRDGFKAPVAQMDAFPTPGSDDIPF